MFSPMRHTRLGLLAATLFLALAPARPISSQAPATEPRLVAPLSPEALSRTWLEERRDYGPPALVDHALVLSELKRISAASEDLFTLEEIGRSVEGRPILRLAFGRGPFHVLLWSQMHGDEPTATPALLHMAEHVRRHREEPAIARMLDELTVHMVPMRT